MEFKNVITIDNLTTESVSVKSQRVLVDNGGTFPIGDPVRTAYVKESPDELTEHVPEPYLSAILGVWGIEGAGTTENAQHSESE